MARMRPPRCVACDCDETRREPYYYDWRDRRFWLWRCRRCTHQFVHPSVTLDDQRAIYGDEYFSGTGDWACGIFPAGYRESTAKLREEARDILALIPLTTGRLLDIGCAGGVFLNSARATGFDGTGIELNPSMAEYARRTYGLDVLTARMQDVAADRWNRVFDVVTLLDCLEHIPAPLQMLRKIACWLRPGGYVFIRGPLSNSRIAWTKEWLRRTVGVTKRLPGYPLDANSFTKRSLEALLRIAGFGDPRWIGETSSFANLLARRKD